MFRNELAKLIKNKACIMLFVLSLGLIPALIYFYEGRNWETLREYRENAGNISAMDTGEALEAVSAELDTLKMADTEDTFVTMLRKKESLEILENELKTAESYSLNLDRICSVIKSQLALGDGKGLYTEMLRKKLENYQNLYNVKPAYDSSFGFSKAVAFKPVSVIALLMGVLFASVLFVKDTETGAAELVKTMKNGRRKLMSARVCALLASEAAVLLIYVAAVMIVYGCRAGFAKKGIAGHPLQSVAGYENSGAGYTVGTALFLSFVVCMFGILSVCMLHTILSLLWNTSVSYAVTGIFLAFQFFLYTAVGERSSLVFLKRINVFSALFPADTVWRFSLLGIAGHPVRTVTAVMFFFSIVTVLLAAVLVRTASENGRRFSEIRKIPKKSVKKAASKNTPRVCMLPQAEIRKLYLRSGTLVLMLTVLACSFMMGMSSEDKPGSAEEYYFRDYVRMTEGKLDAGKENWVEAERKKTEAELEVLNQRAFAENRKRDCEARKEALARLASYIDSIKKHKEPEIVYYKGYEKLLAGKESLVFIPLLLYFSVGIAFTLYWGMEYNSGMDVVISVSKTGEKRIRKLKEKNEYSAAFLMSVLAALPYFLWIKKHYRMSGFSFAGYNLPALNRVSCGLPYWSLLAVWVAVTFAGLFAEIKLIRKISEKRRNNAETMLLATAGSIALTVTESSILKVLLGLF